MRNNNNKNMLLENQLKRYREIISYNDKLINETTYRFFNEADDEQQTQDPNGVNQDTNINQVPNDMGQLPNTGNPETNMNADPNSEQMPPDSNGMVQDPSLQTQSMDTPAITSSPEMGDTSTNDTEIDVTELVNTTKGIAHRIEKITDNIQNLQRMYDKINDMQSSLSKMDTVIAKMGEMEKQIQLMRPPTEDERRKALADKSYPYNVTSQDYLSGKGYKNQTNMENKPDKMSMMDTIMSDYDRNDVKRSFYPQDDDKRDSNY